MKAPTSVTSVRQVGFEEREKRRPSGQWICPTEQNGRIVGGGKRPILCYGDKGKLITHIRISTYL